MLVNNADGNTRHSSSMQRSVIGKRGRGEGVRIVCRLFGELYFGWVWFRLLSCAKYVMGLL